MAYVIAEPCIGQKDNSCVEVCPVDCIHPTPDEPDYERAGGWQRLAMRRKDYVRDIVGPAQRAGMRLLLREWTRGGNPLNRPSLFVFRKGKRPA